MGAFQDVKVRGPETLEAGVFQAEGIAHAKEKRTLHPVLPLLGTPRALHVED